MFTMITLNKTIATITTPILFLDNQREYVSLTQDTTIAILWHKTCVYICTVSSNMYPVPSIGHLQAVIGMEIVR